MSRRTRSKNASLKHLEKKEKELSESDSLQNLRRESLLNETYSGVDMKKNRQLLK